MKDLGVKPYLFPMPVLMIATYCDDGKVDVMNMAWGGICDTDKVALNLDETHKTSENIKKRRAFTLSVADIAHLKEADYFGIVSSNDVPDKFERTGLTAVKSQKVDAPIIAEFPLTLECELMECQHPEGGFRVLGRIVGVLADEKILTDGEPDVKKLGAFVFDQFTNGYYAIGEKIGEAWSSGAELVDKK